MEIDSEDREFEHFESPLEFDERRLFEAKHQTTGKMTKHCFKTKSKNKDDNSSIVNFDTSVFNATSEKKSKDSFSPNKDPPYSFEYLR
jgi:hypothetical protein